MSDGFGAAAAQLAGVAAQALGWPPDVFWNATPADLANCLGLGCASPSGADRSLIETLTEQFPDV